MNYFIELLQVSLNNRKELSGIPTSKEWAVIFFESQRQAITGVMLDGIERLPQSQRPQTDLLLQWIGNVQLIEQTNIRHRKYAQELTTIFNDAGVPCCVIKGVGTAMCYPNPLKRQGGDIDLWVIGNRRTITQWLRTQCEVTGVIWHHEHAEFYNDVEVEVHYHPSWLYNPIHNHRLQQYFKNLQEEQLMGRKVGYCYPTHSFESVFSLTHTFHHLVEEGVGLRHVIDYYHILSGLSMEDRVQSLQQIKRIGMYRFLGAMMYVLEKACGMPRNVMLCEPNVKEGIVLFNEIMAAGNFGHQRKGKMLKHNSLKRFWLVSVYYPSEGMWMIPRKAYQVLWRNIRKVFE